MWVNRGPFTATEDLIISPGREKVFALLKQIIRDIPDVVIRATFDCLDRWRTQCGRRQRALLLDLDHTLSGETSKKNDIKHGEHAYSLRVQVDGISLTLLPILLRHNNPSCVIRPALKTASTPESPSYYAIRWGRIPKEICVRPVNGTEH